MTKQCAKVSKKVQFLIVSSIVVISEFKNNKITIAKAAFNDISFKNLFFLCEIELCILHFLCSQTSNASNSENQHQIDIWRKKSILLLHYLLHYFLQLLSSIQIEHCVLLHIQCNICYQEYKPFTQSGKCSSEEKKVQPILLLDYVFGI